MKILLVNDNYSEVGGAETYFFSLKKLLEKHHHDVYIFSLSPKFANRNKKIFVCRENKYKIIRDLSSLFNLRIYKEFKRWTERVKPDLIHFNINNKYPLSLVSAAKSQKMPFVQTVHDFGIVCPTNWCVKNKKICKGGIGLQCLNRYCKANHHTSADSWPRYFINVLSQKIKTLLVKNKFSAYITPSRILQRYLLKHGFKNVLQLYNFIDLPIDKSWTTEIDKDSILFIGRLSKEKGLKYLIQAVSKVSQKIPKVKLDIIGEGRERKNLEELTKKLNLLEKIKFLGKLPHPKVRKHYQRTSLIILPSIWMENNPMTILEAMAYGKATVGSNNGGIPELVQGHKTGLLFETGNSNDLAKKIIYLLNNPEIIKEYGNKAKKICKEKYNQNSHYTKLMKIYKTAIRKEIYET